MKQIANTAVTAVQNLWTWDTGGCNSAMQAVEATLPVASAEFHLLEVILRCSDSTQFEGHAQRTLVEYDAALLHHRKVYQ